MAAAAIRSRDEALAGGLAFAMHVLFLVLLVFGVSWQHKPADTAVIVDLWRDLPSVTPPRVEPPPPPPEVKPEPPKPAPKVEAKPPPKPEPAPVPKPDIALKEKQEKERKLKAQQEAEARKKLAAEKAREAELEKKKRAEAEALKQKQAAEAEAKRVAAEQQKARDALAAQQAAAQAKVVDEYKRQISAKIRRFIVLPPNVSDAAQVEFEITVLPGGEVLGAKLKRTANSIPAYDAAVERAILRAQPLPLPPDPALMRQFRELNLVFRPKD
ncbi:MAG: cell envelope integrity protein TolA [Burkholderiales bacterium]|nr:cell envelope integrity protein TolA [Verrucomicrobiae bacterium]MCW5605233.1 cell envelope integrity protein TolA [Burkholderiales bacterium]